VKLIKNCDRGFTLIEILVVITLIGVIMAVMVSSGGLQNMSAQNNSSKMVSDLSLIQNAFGNYHTEECAYPTGLADATFVPTYIFSPPVPTGWDAAYGTNGYLIGVQTGQAAPNNGYYVCARVSVLDATDPNWKATTLMALQFAPTQYFVNTSCTAVTNMAAPAGEATAYVTFWLTRY